MSKPCSISEQGEQDVCGICLSSAPKGVGIECPLVDLDTSHQPGNQPPAAPPAPASRPAVSLVPPADPAAAPVPIESRSTSWTDRVVPMRPDVQQEWRGYDDQTPVPEIVEMAERLLQMAKSGELRGLAMAQITKDPSEPFASFGTAWFNGPNSHRFVLMSAVNHLAFRMHHGIEHKEVDEQGRPIHPLGA